MIRLVIVIAAAAVMSGLGMAGALLFLRREIRRASLELRRYRRGYRNARIRTSLGLLSGLWSDVNAVLEDAQRLELDGERTKQRLKDLLSCVSHDIRTPLTSIIGYLQALVEGVPGSREEEREFIDIVHAKAESIRDYSESVFRLARLEADEIKAAFVPVDLAELLRRSVLSFAPFLEGKGFTVDIRIPETRHEIQGEEVSLLRIFQNLIGNAVRHGGEGKYLGISLLSEKNVLTVTVEDHGRGFSEELMKRILLDSWAVSTSTGARSGEGLGLLITKHLVEAHGSTFGIESIPSERTTIRVCFPCKENVRNP